MCRRLYPRLLVKKNMLMLAVWITTGLALMSCSLVNAYAENFLLCSQTTYNLQSTKHISATLDGILAKFAGPLQIKIQPKINVYYDLKPEAFYTPGIVHISSGMLNIAESDDQLAFILAHELGHEIETLPMPSSPILDQNLSTLLSDELAADYAAVTLIQQLGFRAEKAIKILNNIQNLLPQQDLYNSQSLAYQLNYRFKSLGSIIFPAQRS